MSFIEVKNIRKTFDDNVAVDDISFRVESGQIFGFLGPNGAGKTTSIRMIMNITMPDSGTINFDGNAMSEPLKQKIGYLPEERGLYPKMKVQPMLQFLGELKGMSRSEALKAIDHWFERFDIESWRNKKLEELSKGMQQKVQFISTIMHDPDMIIFDEPFSGLDPVNVDLLRDIILEFKEKGKIVFFSTHVMEKAEQLCDEIFLIDNGKVILSGKLDEIKKQFSDNVIDLEFTGDGSFIKDISYVEKFAVDGGKAVVHFNDPEAGSRFLKDISQNIDVLRYNPRVKTLHEIFVSQVGGNHA